MLKTLIEAFALISTWEVIIAMLAASVYGLVIGSLPGLSATMATALLVPVTFYLSPIAAIATIVAASSMAIFSGDIPGALLRIPGTPASAAYADEAYAMTRKGEAELALGAGVWFSAVGGIAGTLSLMILAPPLAEIALSFSTFEYFWLAFLGLMCATLVARSSPVKAIASMFIGLLVACVGIENPGGVPRFTFGLTDLFGGIEPIPALVGVFAVAQVMRAMLTPEPPPIPKRKFGSIMAGQWRLTKNLSLADDAREHRRHHHRRAAGRRRRHGGLGLLRDVEEILQDAGKIRHRPCRGPGRGRRQQQCHDRVRLGAVAAVRHSRRHHRGDRDRRALHERPQSRPDAVHRKSVEHVRDLSDVHHRQHPDDPARHRDDPAGRATCCARRAPR